MLLLVATHSLDLMSDVCFYGIFWYDPKSSCISLVILKHKCLALGTFPPIQEGSSKAAICSPLLTQYFPVTFTWLPSPAPSNTMAEQTSLILKNQDNRPSYYRHLLISLERGHCTATISSPTVTLVSDCDTCQIEYS